MHGGAPGSGAPRGNQNALKHGRYRREAVEERFRLHDLMKTISETLKSLNDAEPPPRK